MERAERRKKRNRGKKGAQRFGAMKKGNLFSSWRGKETTRRRERERDDRTAGDRDEGRQGEKERKRRKERERKREGEQSNQVWRLSDHSSV